MGNWANCLIVQVWLELSMGFKVSSVMEWVTCTGTRSKAEASSIMIGYFERNVMPDKLGINLSKLRSREIGSVDTKHTDDNTDLDGR